MEDGGKKGPTAVVHEVEYFLYVARCFVHMASKSLNLRQFLKSRCLYVLLYK